MLSLLSRVRLPWLLLSVLRLFFPLLTAFSINSLQLLLSFAVVLPSPLTLSGPQPTHSPPFPLHFLDMCSLDQLYISHSFRLSGPFPPLPHQFLLKTEYGMFVCFSKAYIPALHQHQRLQRAVSSPQYQSLAGRATYHRDGRPQGSPPTAHRPRRQGNIDRAIRTC